MKILVTGALGLIGSELSKALSLLNVHVKELDIRYATTNSAYADICNKEEIMDKIHDCDGVVHLAGISRIAWGESDPVLCNKINTQGTDNLLQACLHSKRKPWFIFASSREVYGLQESFPVKESCILQPKNIYAQSKLAAEQLVEHAFTVGLQACILRFSNVYGGLFDHCDRVVPAFCINALNNRTIRIDGKDCIYDFTHVEDVIDGILKTIDFLSHKKCQSISKIHFTTSVPTSLFELAKTVIDTTNSSSNIELLPARTYGTTKFYGDYSLANSLLGWKPLYGLQAGLTKFIVDLQTQVENKPFYFAQGINESFKSYSWLPSTI